MTDDSNEKTTLERVEAALEQAKAAAAEIPTPKPDGRARDEQRHFDHQESMQKVQLGFLGRLWAPNTKNSETSPALYWSF